MDIRKDAVTKYWEDGIPYRALAKKYGVSHTTFNRSAGSLWECLLSYDFPFLCKCLPR